MTNPLEPYTILTWRRELSFFLGIGEGSIDKIIFDYSIGFLQELSQKETSDILVQKHDMHSGPQKGNFKAHSKINKKSAKGKCSACVCF